MTCQLEKRNGISIPKIAEPTQEAQHLRWRSLKGIHSIHKSLELVHCIYRKTPLSYFHFNFFYILLLFLLHSRA